MRVICTHCQFMVALPDSAAGQPTPCPHCGQSFVPPALTGAALDASPIPPPAPPPPPPRPAAPGRTPAETAYRPAAAPGDPRLRVTLRRDVVLWLPVLGLLLAFLFSFFSWVGSYPNGRAVYTQTAWQAAFGRFSTDSAGEEAMRAEKDLRLNAGWTWSLVLFVLLLIPLVGLAVADRLVPLLDLPVPDVARSIWPYREFALFAGCVALSALLGLACLFGFGLETTAARTVDKAVEIPKSADGSEPTTAEVQKREVRRDVLLGNFALDRTIWYRLAALGLLTALTGCGLQYWLRRRGDQPEPRVEFFY